MIRQEEKLNKDFTLQVRLNRHQQALVDAASRSLGIKRSDYVRKVLTASAKSHLAI